MSLPRIAAALMGGAAVLALAACGSPAQPAAPVASVPASQPAQEPVAGDFCTDGKAAITAIQSNTANLQSKDSATQAAAANDIAAAFQKAAASASGKTKTDATSIADVYSSLGKAVATNDTSAAMDALKKVSDKSFMTSVTNFSQAVANC